MDLEMALQEWPEIEAIIKGPNKRHELVIKGPLNRDMDLNYEELQKLAFYEGVPVNFISLTHCNLFFLNASIANCTQLTRLTLANNVFTDLPEEIGTLAHLKFLDVSDNKLAELPSSFKNLTKLESFVAARNELKTEFLFDFSNLEQLNVIDLSNNQLTAIPHGLGSGKLQRLHTINLSYNEVIEIEESFATLEQLKELSLASNKLEAIPGPIGRLGKIRLLDLSNNVFKDTRFAKLTNDKRTKVNAIIAYINKNATVSKKPVEEDVPEKMEESVSEIERPLVIILGEKDYTVQRLSSVKDIRPYLVCCVFKNLDISGDNFRKFIAIQTKLHSSLCGNRTKAAIGTHDLNSFCAPLKYLALPIDELHITALHKKSPISARELVETLCRDADMARRRSKRNTLNPLHRYLHLVENMTTLPCLIDSNGLVMSLAPVTNSDTTKLSELSTAVWVEVSSTESIQICKEAMEQIIKETLHLCPALTIAQVRVITDNGDLLSVYPDKNDLNSIKTERRNE